MIEGLHFDWQGQKLQDHLLLRVEHHNGRSAFYERMVTTLHGDGAFDDLPEPSGSNFTRGRDNPAEDAKTRAERHRVRARLFRAQALSVSVGETYRLSSADLEDIEAAEWIP